MTEQAVTVESALENYLADHPVVEATEQVELKRFEQWLGKTKILAGLKPLDMEHYAGRFSPSDPDGSRKLEIVRRFLAYTRDQGWTATNLGIHLKAKKSKPKVGGVTRAVRPELAVLTRQGYVDLVRELAELKVQRPQVLEEIRRAAADKDFRENAPLQAAREQLGHIDGRIQELTATIKSASIIGEVGTGGDRMAVGDTIILVETVSEQTLEYTVVGPKETNPAKGRISHISPIGRAVIGKSLGDVIEVATPAGSHCYRIKGIQKC
ncbi:MAG: transcription elongation factor GreA [Dehalococcoidia bacterium]|nr:transcription elongation factor GreA [Dehalococcoidia bacterium]